jgi:UDP-N-acetylglucosamine 4,6-dehydratase
VSSIAGKSIVVTGASGSLGLALLRRISDESPSEIRTLQRSQVAASQIRAAVLPQIPVEAISADVADRDAVARAIEGADLVFHLAGLKDVIVCEERPALAVRTNVSGSDSVVQAVARSGHAVMVAASTDKASPAASVLGLTKALMERIVCAERVGSSVRLGGVLGSSGSVLDAWRRGARERGVIEVTDPESTRFVMTIDEAVSALIEASERGRRGEILVPTMRSYRLGDLATAFAHVDRARLEVVGLRRGEVRHAEALSDTEAARATQQDHWRVLAPGRQLGGTSALRSDLTERLTPADLEDIVGAWAASR